MVPPRARKGSRQREDYDRSDSEFLYRTNEDGRIVSWGLGGRVSPAQAQTDWIEVKSAGGYPGDSPAENGLSGEERGEGRPCNHATTKGPEVLGVRRAGVRSFSICATGKSRGGSA